MRNRLLLFSGILLMICIIIQSCENEQSLNYKKYYVNGKGLYEKKCQNCHGINGEGLNKLYPPLTDTSYLLVNKDKLACIIRYGQREVITINGQTFAEQMPGDNQLADIDIAQIIVYIGNSFGNNLGYYPVTQVNQDLSQCN